MAETLNKLFSSTTQTSGPNKCKPDLTHISQYLNELPKLSLEKTSAIEVQYEEMMKIKPNKATGCALIFQRAVKESAAVLCHPFNTLVKTISAQKSSNAAQQLPMIPCAKSVMRSNFMKAKRLLFIFCSGDFEERSCKNYAFFCNSFLDLDTGVY